MWKKWYRTRQHIERVFEGMKKSRRLNAHCDALFALSFLSSNCLESQVE